MANEMIEFQRNRRMVEKHDKKVLDVCGLFGKPLNTSLILILQPLVVKKGWKEVKVNKVILLLGLSSEQRVTRRVSVA